jgi:hypothetical protein
MLGTETIPDYCTEAGARRLAERLAEFWRRADPRGADRACFGTVPTYPTPPVHNLRWGVRSNLRNRVPP